MAIFTLGKVHLRPKDITRNEKYHFVMINELIHQDNITMLNVFAPNNKVLKYIKKKKKIELKGEIEKSANIVRYVNTSPLNN